MTNEEKYKTPEERNKAFHRFCKSVNDCSVCPLGKVPNLRCPFAWLALEAEEEKPLPCPFCGRNAVCDRTPGISPNVRCTGCGALIYRDTLVDAIAAWNRRVK